MKKKLVLLVLGLSICTAAGCASSTQGDDVEASPTVVDESAVPEQPRRAATVEKRNQSASTNQQAPTVQVSAAPKAVSADTRENEVQGPARPVEMKIANGLDRNPYLSSRLKPLLPVRTTVTDAAAGFKNQRQFIAALHVSKNLGIPFDQIKMRMTDEDRMSLDEAVRDLRPEMTKNLVKAEVKKAEAQAKDDENLAKDEAKKAAAQEKLAANTKS